MAQIEWRWLTILEKLYLWDWSMTPEGGPRFENLVASQLLKYCHFLEDTEGHAMELRFIDSGIPGFFQGHLGDRHFETGPATVLPFRTFCRELNLP